MANMERVNIVDTNLIYNVNDLVERERTDFIVIHHVADDNNADTDAKAINDLHIHENHWIAIGYHFVIRKDGTIEKGRPVWSNGAHAQGYNTESIGICLSGNFEIGNPTDQQIESLAMLLANLCADYNIPIDRKHILGHRELNNTGCPGDNLYDKLDVIVGKANFYRYPPEHVAKKIDIPKMTTEQLAHEIAIGITKTGIEGGFNSISCSTAGDYPSIGVSQWEGDRADALLHKISGGVRFMDLPFSQLVSKNMIYDLKHLLDSEEGRKVQIETLEEDCLNYISFLTDIKNLDDPRCLIYAGMWCPTSHYVVRRFLKNRENRVNYKSLVALKDLFYKEYASASSIDCQYYAGYRNRADITYRYVTEIDLTTPYGVPVYGEGINGR